MDDTSGGAYGELATDGRAGETTREVLTEVVLEVAGRRGFVPPAPHLAWGRLMARQHARQDLELLRTGFLMAAWTRAHDEASLRVVLTHEVERQLEARATGWALPELRERLMWSVLPADDTLGCDEGDETHPALWWSPGAAQDTWRAGPDDLDRAAAALRAVPAERRGSGDRAVLATQDTLMALARTVLDRVGARVRLDDLAHLVAERLAERPARETRPVLTGSVAEGASGEQPGPESGVLVADTARRLFDALTPLQRRLVPHLGQPPADVAVRLGLDPVVAEAASTALVRRLRDAETDDELAAEVLLALHDLCVRRG